MNIDPTKPYAVITGDFIGFSGLPLEARQGMYSVVKKAGDALNRAFPGVMVCSVDMFRGDGWQILLADPVLSLRAALYFRAFIRANTALIKTDTRLAIAVGRVDYVPENHVSAGDGQAFRLSGGLLEEMARPKAGAMRFTMDNPNLSHQLDAVVRLIGALADRWTSRQALAVTGALQNWRQEQIGRLWDRKISHQAVGRHLERAAWPAVRHALEVFERVVSHSLE